MADFSSVAGMLGELKQKIEAIEDELGRLSNQIVPGAQPQVPKVIPPTVPELEVVDGIETGEYPDCCAVGSLAGYFCSGTLIAPNLVLTADHCKGVDRVFLRGNDITQLDKGEVIAVKTQFSHPDLDARILVLEHDSTVEPRKIAKGNQTQGHTQATVVGFGTIDLQGLVGYGRKRYAVVPIATLDCKGSSDAKRFGCVPGFELVAGQRGLRFDSCRGDSGGPLYIKNGKGEYLLLGVTSRGTRESFTACGDGGVYVRADMCLDWLKDETGVSV
jgi:Trypsin